MIKDNNYETIECVVIGAGVVGLAIGAKMARSGMSVLVLEEQEKIGTGISSRNSEVIHAGIYYPKSSLKAQLCVRGKYLLYEYAQKSNIEHKKCGKIIVATKGSQLKTLEQIKSKATENGVDDLLFLTQNEMSNLESDVSCSSALYSPSTGIINTHSLMTSLQGDLENAGGICAFLSSIAKIEKVSDGFLVGAKSQDTYITFKAQFVINAAGMGAVDVAKKIVSFPEDKIPSLKLAKGNYFSLIGKHNFNHLIYPVPEGSGLGIHLTLDLNGKARFGPDVEWVDVLEYSVNKHKSEVFYNAIRSYWPTLKEGRLIPDYAGIRPKIYFGENAYTDFIIQGQNEHGIEGLVNLLGIESPGLTSSLAIAEYVHQLIFSASDIRSEK